jgi:hypothetical protein
MKYYQALENLENGLCKTISRSGWNGKGMFVFRMPGYPGGVPANKATALAMGIFEGDIVIVHPYLAIKTAQNTIGAWTATQPDVFGDDWECG